MPYACITLESSPSFRRVICARCAPRKRIIIFTRSTRGGDGTLFYYTVVLFAPGPDERTLAQVLYRYPWTARFDDSAHDHKYACVLYAIFRIYTSYTFGT